MSTDTDQAPCHLLALLPELRNHVWHYALPVGEKINTLQARIICVDSQQCILHVQNDQPYSYQ